MTVNISIYPIILLGGVAAGGLAAQAQTFSHFEARQVHAIGLTPDGRRLLAVNSPDASLSVFDCSRPERASPLLIAEIPVGLEPVTVRARNDAEAWVVNEISDSISVVSLTEGKVLDTIQTGDEPADVCFAAGKAFVTCSGSREIRVYDAATRASAGSIALDGIAPRALAASPDGGRLYAAFLLSGNGTTVLPRTVAPAQPSPTNPALPAPPQTALIVPVSDPRVRYTVLDHDVAEIDTATLQVRRYFGSLGTHLFDLSVRPGSDELWVANSESLNLIRYEPNLRARFARHRLSRLALSGDAAPPATHDLNPEIDYQVLPNADAASRALAQPTALTFTGDGSRAWIAAFNSDRLAEIDPASGKVLRRVDLRPGAGEGPEKMRGPRALALHPSSGRLFVLNKLSNTIGTVDTVTASLLSEVPAGSCDPTPAVIRRGRGFLFDARLSGNGTVSCASCHLDSDRDGLAWDQGDPGGEMVTMKGAFLSAHFTTLEDRQMHPMKGPMVTQTLIGMGGNLTPLTTPAQAVTAKFHWRGDKPSIQSFNSTYDKLMGGAQLATADIDALAAYLMALRHAPNPYRNPDRTLPASIDGGNPSKGRDMFNNHEKSHCMICHALPSGTDQNIDRKLEVNGTQEMKNPPLRTVYQRSGLFLPVAGATCLSGFGLGSDGTGYEMPKSHFYQLDNLNTNQELKDVAAFLLAFDSGTAPTVGRSLTVDYVRALTASVQAEMTLLEQRAAAGDCDVVLRGRLGGEGRCFRFSPAEGRYIPDRLGEAPLTRGSLLASLQPGDSLTLLGVLPGNGPRLGGDRNEDGVLDGSENPPVLGISSLSPQEVRLQWPGPSSRWYPETSPTPAGPWTPLNTPSQILPAGESAPWPTTADSQRFFRLHSTR